MKALIKACALLFLFNTVAFSHQVSIFAANYPLAFFTERLCQQQDLVKFPNTEGDPAFWQPTPEEINQVQHADIILFNGAGYEKWRNRASLPDRKIVNTSRLFKDQYIQRRGQLKHSHGNGGLYAHGETAFTTWIDFTQATVQLEAIKLALVATNKWPKQSLDANFSTLKNELLEIDQAITQLVENKAEVFLIGSHPVYDYFARRYHLNLRSVHWEPDQLPDEKKWTELKQLLKSHPAKWMIWEAEPKPEIVAKLRQLDIESVVFDPCSTKPATGDFLTVMRQNVDNMRVIFRSVK